MGVGGLTGPTSSVIIGGDGTYVRAMAACGCSLCAVVSATAFSHQLVGRLLIDVGVPSRVITSAVANDVIELANDQLSARTGLETAFDNAEGRWTLARLTGAVIDPDRSLAEVGRWIDEVSSCSRSSQRACAPAVSARDARVRHHRSARM